MNYIYKKAFQPEHLKRLQTTFEKVSNDKFVIKEELSYLSRILYNEEKIKALLSGVMNDIDCLIVLTDKRIILIDTTLIFITIKLNEVNSITYKIINSFGELFIKDNLKERYIKNISKSTVKLFTNLVIDTIENYNKNYSEENAKKEMQKNYYLELEKLIGLKKKDIFSENKANGIKQKLINGTI